MLNNMISNLNWFQHLLFCIKQAWSDWFPLLINESFSSSKDEPKGVALWPKRTIAKKDEKLYAQSPPKTIRYFSWGISLVKEMWNITLFFEAYMARYLESFISAINCWMTLKTFFHTWPFQSLHRAIVYFWNSRSQVGNAAHGCNTYS